MSDYVRESVAAYEATPRRMNVAEYYLAAEKGIFKPGERLELIHGEVWQKVSPQKSFHAATISIVNDTLEHCFGSEIYLRQQLPIALDEWNEPEPDVAVVRGHPKDYWDRHPNAADTLLVVEVADTTLKSDRGLKARLYAEFGIAEYWIVNLRDGQVEIFRDPLPGDSPSYASSQVIVRDGTVSPVHGNGRTIAVRDIIPKTIP